MGLGLVILFALTWGFLFLDRITITFLFPILTKEFGLNNAQVGLISMATSLGYALFSILFSIIADRSGYRKKWLVPFLIIAAIISGSSAFAATFSAFLIIRLFTGVSEGPVFPLISSMVSVQGRPEKFALNIGIISVGATALTTVFGPIIVTQIAIHLDWHYAFILTSLPTLVLAIFVWAFTKEVDRTKVMEAAKGEKINLGDFIKILKYRNITLSLLLVALVMLALWTIAIYMPLYLVTVAKMSTEAMGFFMAGYGALGLVWCLVIPIVSNRIGRKPTVIIFSLLAAVPFLAMYLSTGVVAKALFLIFAGILTFLPLMFFGVIGIETVPPHFAVTASALIMGIGEIFGAAIAPVILGGIADGYGLPVVFIFGAIALILAAAISFGLIETNPHIRAKKGIDII